MTINGYQFLNQLAKLADSATDELLQEAFRETLRCGIKDCELCAKNQQLIQAIRELRELRIKDAKENP